ncbi:hypothetical protein M9Y10_000913 [Tritrichomonas musculus]|uniref:TAF6 C-terminal HEAT repeat domain-containing protein n=1 Tax=Tritrichomonas musculus TaxID=1915356 RepID=A0ABR2L6I3_9EUKA
MSERIEYVTIDLIAQSLNLQIKTGVPFLALETKVYLKNIISLANRFTKAKHSKKLTTENVNESLKSKGLEPLYGYLNRKTNIEYTLVGRSFDNTDIYIQKQKMIKISDMTIPQLEEYPLDSSFSFHWLAINGLQPCISANETEDSTLFVTPDEIHWPPKITNQTKEELGRQTDPQVFVPSELRKLFLTSLVKIRENENIDDVIEELSTNGSLHRLLPYYIRLLSDLMAVNLRHPSYVARVLCITNALLLNESLSFDSVLHKILAIVLAPLLDEAAASSEDYNTTFFDAQYRVLDDAASLLSLIVNRFQFRFPSLIGILAEKLTNVFFEKEFKRPFLIAKYGSLAGLLAIGPDIVRDTILPKLKFIIEKLEKRLKTEDNGSHINRIERSEMIRLKSYLMHSCRVVWMKCQKTKYKLDDEIINNMMTYFGSSIFDEK